MKRASSAIVRGRLVTHNNRFRFTLRFQRA